MTMPKTAAPSLKTKIMEIQSIYERVAARIIDVLSGLDPATFTMVDHGRALARVREIVLLLNDQVRMWAPAAIRAAYDESAAVSRTRLELIGAKKLSERRYNPARHDKKVAALVKTVSRDFFKANLTIEKTAKRFLSIMSMTSVKVSRAKLQEFDSKTVRSWINDLVVEATAANEARTKVYAQIRDKLLAKLKGADFININGRNYNLRDYSELVAGVRMREAASEATLESAAEYDHDLVEIQAILDPCEICADIQGKVYSVSGDSPDYPELTDDITPPIHPRCRHVLSVVSEAILARRTA
jgi:hypothetical protein